MVIVAQHARQPLLSAALRNMFEARKRVFVDLLSWDVPVLGGRFELDQFDDEHAVYLIVADGEGEHLASARLLPTMRPHILDSLFPQLCQVPCPRGPDVMEITRFCLDRRGNARDRRVARDRLVSAIVAYGLEHHIRTYLGVAEMGWLQQILAFGWRCGPLGLPRVEGGRTLGALSIDIDGDTPSLLAANGIFEPVALQHAPERAAA